MKNYYSILGIPEDASDQDIKKAYRELAKKFHPDINRAKDAHDKFIEITEAYEFLIEQRKLEVLTDNPQNSENANQTADTAWYYERLRQQVREKAQQHARVKYEQFKKQHEAFRESGLEDAGLLLTIIFRVMLIIFFFYLVSIPFIMAYRENSAWLFLMLVTWPIAGFIGWFVYEKRRGYFIPGTFYYNLPRIIKLFTEVHPTAFKCYYCPSLRADSKPYAVELLRLKGLRLATGGFRQHTVNYVNKNVKIIVPRSRRAFLIHSVVSLVKLLAVAGSLMFLDVSSILWRLIIGMALAGFLGFVIFIITNTKSNVSYLISAGSLVRFAIWLAAIVMVSDFSLKPFNVTTNDTIQLVVASILMFDCLLMQILSLLIGENSYIPLLRQYNQVDLKFREGFRVYNDVTILSVVYPFFKWIFG